MEKKNRRAQECGQTRNYVHAPLPYMFSPFSIRSIRFVWEMPSFFTSLPKKTIDTYQKVDKAEQNNNQSFVDLPEYQMNYVYRSIHQNNEYIKGATAESANITRRDTMNKISKRGANHHFLSCKIYNMISLKSFIL